MESKFEHYPISPRNAVCQKAHVILCNAHLAATSFLDIFDSTRRQRKAKGTPTDEEQDLLRAMLTFATAGLDAMIKQLINDALAKVIDRDEGATRRFRESIEKRLERENKLDRKLLTEVLVDLSPRQRLIREVVNDLISQSLQSKDQLLRAAAAFAIEPKQICGDLELLRDIFAARNQIAHEMDVDFGQPNRSRRPRKRDTMIQFTNEVFKICNAFLTEVDAKVA